MAIDLSPIQLVNSFFTDFSIRGIRGQFADPALQLIAKYQKAIEIVDDEPEIWGMELTVKLLSTEDRKASYEGVFSLSGMFALHPNLEEEEKVKWVTKSGAAVLFSSIREAVAQVSSRCGHGVLFLPILDLTSLKVTETDEIFIPESDFDEEEEPTEEEE